MATATDSADLGSKTKTRVDFKHEPYALAKLVASTGNAQDGWFPAFVRYRFRQTFLHALQGSSRYSKWFTWLSVFSIGGGLASTTLVAIPGTNDLAVGAVGLFVAVTAAVNRLWRPGLRSVVSHRNANDLRSEGWDYVSGRGKYAELDEAGRRATFIEQVERINATAEMIDEEPIDEEKGTSHTRRGAEGVTGATSDNGHSGDVQGAVPVTG